MSATTKKRISQDEYQRPIQTYTEKLTRNDIKNKLEDYIKIDNIKDLKVGQHIRYFIKSDDETLKFRSGGTIIKIDKMYKYIVLTNSKLTWSVQVQNSVLFRKLTVQELKDEFKKKLDDITSENEKIKKENKCLIEYIKQLKNKKQTSNEKNINCENLVKELPNL